jgi:hypothetical protein
MMEGPVPFRREARAASYIDIAVLDSLKARSNGRFETDINFISLGCQVSLQNSIKHFLGARNNSDIEK